MKAFKKSTSKASDNADASASPSITKGKSTIFKQEIQDRLIDLIKSGNIESFEKCVEPESPELVALNRFHTKSGKTPLGVAAEEGRRTESELLINTKAVDIDLKDTNGMTASMYAAKNGELEVLELLMNAGADPAVVFEASKETLLFMAARNNHIEIVKYLISREQPPEVINIRHESPLWNALKSQHFPLATLLLQNNANINLQRPGGGTALFAACFANQPPLVQFILANGGDPNIAAEGDETCLMVAARHGFTSIMQLLLDAEASVNAVTTAGRSALITAVIANKAEAVELLLKHSSQQQRVDLNIADIWGFTALTFACRGGKGSLPIVQLLLDHGATVDCLDRTRNTPLLHCCLTHNLAAGLLLLDAGADCECRNIDDFGAVELIAAMVSSSHGDEENSKEQKSEKNKAELEELREDRRLFLSALAQVLDRNKLHGKD